MVAARLGVSISGLARGGITEPLTTAQIEALREEEPEWLQRERAVQAEARKESARIRRSAPPKPPAPDPRDRRAAPARTTGAAGPAGGRTAGFLIPPDVSRRR